MWLTLAGCASHSPIAQYTPPKESGAADIQYLVTDHYRGNETLRISLLTRPSCTEKPNLSQLAVLRSGGLFGGDSNKPPQSAQLPANRTLNIQVSESSDINVFDTGNAGSLTAECSKLRAYRLESGEKYLLKIHDRNAGKPSYARLACGFNVVETDGTGREIRVLTPSKPDLPVCAG